MRYFCKVASSLLRKLHLKFNILLYSDFFCGLFFIIYLFVVLGIGKTYKVKESNFAYNVKSIFNKGNKMRGKKLGKFRGKFYKQNNAFYFYSNEALEIIFGSL